MSDQKEANIYGVGRLKRSTRMAFSRAHTSAFKAADVAKLLLLNTTDYTCPAHAEYGNAPLNRNYNRTPTLTVFTDYYQNLLVSSVTRVPPFHQIFAKIGRVVIA